MSKGKGTIRYTQKPAYVEKNSKASGLLCLAQMCSPQLAAEGFIP